MEFPFFNNRRESESLVLLIDVGSASIGASLARIEKGQHPHILTSIREDISFQEVISSHRFMNAMSHSLDKALRNIQKKTKNFGNPAHIFCTLSSPWFILKTRSISITRDEEFEITPEEISNIINSDIEHLKEELKETLPPSDMRIVEKKIIQIRLNGYEVKNPYKQKTSRVEISAIVGVSSQKVVENIEKRIKSFFHSKSIHFGAFPIAAFSVIRDIFPAEKNFLFLDVTGEATDVSLVNNNILVETSSFPLGRNFFIREISSELRTVHEEASTLFAMFARNELDEKRRVVLERILTRAEGQWRARFIKAADRLFKNRASSHRVFFTSDADTAPLFSKIIESSKTEHPLVLPIEAFYLDRAIVSNFVTFETEVTRDPFIVIESLLALKLIEQHT